MIGTFILALSCSQSFAELQEQRTGSPINKASTQETKALFFNLKNQMGKGFLFGHHHSTVYGIDWKNDANQSDVKKATGSFPAVYGWDMGHMGTESSGNKNAKVMAKLIVDAYDRGGINTISWHMKHPVTGENYKANGQNTVKKVLPNGSHHKKLLSELDWFSNFVSNLKGKDGKLVPIIFRPWHEHTGGWFWWGKTSCTPKEYIELWRFTVAYLKEKKVSNLLYAYSPSQVGISNVKDYEANRFPGYDYIDVLGIDAYTNEVTKGMVKLCEVIVKCADRHGKIAALTEGGYRNGINNSKNPKWYTQKFLEPIKANASASRIAWALVWRNAHRDHYWVPVKGDKYFSDFKIFSEDPFVLFENDLGNFYEFPRK